MRRLTIIVPLVLFAGLALGSSCEEDNSGSQNTERATARDSYARQVAAQPAHRMDYSPTRDTINKWIDTWGRKGTLSFTYLLNQNGEKIGYFVFVGPPVSYCAALTPTYEEHDMRGDNGRVIVTAPAVDGVYYSGGQCVQYYGVDASTGKLVEFSIGGALNFITSTQPLDLTVPALGYTDVDDLEQNADGEYVAR